MIPSYNFFDLNRALENKDRVGYLLLLPLVVFTVSSTVLSEIKWTNNPFLLGLFMGFVVWVGFLTLYEKLDSFFKTETSQHKLQNINELWKDYIFHSVLINPRAQIGKKQKTIIRFKSGILKKSLKSIEIYSTNTESMSYPKVDLNTQESIIVLQNIFRKEFGRIKTKLFFVFIFEASHYPNMIAKSSHDILKSHHAHLNAVQKSH
jgi:hypothetical protein